jgi:hypothetical protein
MPNTLNELIVARKQFLHVKHEEDRAKEEQKAKKTDEEIIKSFSAEYPELVALPEFQWKPKTKFQKEYERTRIGLAFTLGTVTFEANNRTAGACKVCSKCGILKAFRWLQQDEQILDYIIEHPDGNETMETPCNDCRMEENRLKALEPKEVPQYPRTIEEKVYVHVQEIVDLLDIARTD